MADLWIVSLIGAVMILVIIGIRALLQNRLHRTVFLLLWLLVALRLAVPVMTSSTASIYNFLPEKESVSAFASRESVPAPVVIVEEPAVRDPVAGDPVIQGSISGEISVLEPVEIGEIRSTESLTMGQLLTIFWALGCGTCFLYFMVIHIRARLRYRFAIPEKGPDYLGKVALKRSDEVSSPLVYGFFRPVILLPYDFPKTDSPEYEQVLCHELTHIRSGDLWYKLIMLLITCIHWFNPFVWLMLRLSTQDLEIRCDARVIRKLGKKKFYAMTLVQAEVRRSTHFAEVAFAFSLTELRLKSIAKAKVYLPRSIVLFAVLAVVLVCCFSTGPSAKATVDPTVEECVSLQTEAEHTIATEQMTEEITEPTTETTEPKPSPTISVSKDDEMAYLLSCGFEEYGSTMELSLKEGQSKTFTLRLPEYATFSVVFSRRNIATVSWEYSHDEELYYLTVDSYDDGELTIYAFVADRQWMMVEVSVAYDIYYSIPDARNFEPYGSKIDVRTIEGGTKVVALKLPERATYSCSWWLGSIWSRNDLIITTWYDHEANLYYMEFCTYEYGYVYIDFYVDGIYWCELTFDVYRDWAQYGGQGKYSYMTGAHF